VLIKSIILVNKSVGVKLSIRAITMRMKYSALCILMVGNLSAQRNDQIPWTWFHRRVFSEQEQFDNSKEQEITAGKVDLPAFTQLLFSWNAMRPCRGYFTFYARVRNAHTKQWSKWHRMMSWGARVQKSFKTEADRFSSYHHVRLESHANAHADAFAIRIEACGGADLGLIKSFAINLANLDEFIAESEEVMAGVQSVHIKGVPRFSQFEINHPRNDGLCSPTSCAMLTSYLIGKKINPKEFAEKSLDTGLDKYGSWPFNMAHAFERSQGKVSFAVIRLASFKKLYDHLCRNIPVVVSVRGYLQGAPRVYHNGHLLVVVGYDSKTKEVICHDPAVSSAQLAKKRYPLKNFLKAWERSHRLAYFAEPIG
jgi:hypothetical protein